MTPIEILAVVILTAVVCWSLYSLMMRGAAKVLECLSADAGLDAEPSRQARCSTLPEPSNVELLFCLTFIVFCVAALGLLWCGFADGMVRWMIERAAAMKAR